MNVLINKYVIVSLISLLQTLTRTITSLKQMCMVMGKVSQFSIVWHSYTMRDIGEGIFKVVTLLGSNFSFTLASDSPVSLFSPLSLFSSLICHHLQIYMDHTHTTFGDSQTNQQGLRLGTGKQCQQIKRHTRQEKSYW